MEVVLLEKIEKLGTIGDLVKVRAGYARNFLLRKRKALRATKANIAYFESKKAEIEANNTKLKQQAELLAAKMSGISLIIVRQASESGFLFGSIRASDIASELSKQGFTISKEKIKISSPFKTIGNYQVKVALHPEIVVDINLRIETVQQQEYIAQVSQEETVQNNRAL